MAAYGDEFDDVRGHPQTLLYTFKSSEHQGGRYLLAFTARKDLAVIRQHTRTKNGLKEVALGFNSHQLEELQELIPILLKEMKVGQTSDEGLDNARRENFERIEAMEEGAIKTGLRNIENILKGIAKKK